MATLEERFEWLKEVLSEKPESFADYYKEDISNYLDIDGMKPEFLKNSSGRKFGRLLNCNSKKDVQDFVDDITGYVVMKAQIEEIVADYLA
jgi:hypothetical protein